MLALGSTQCAYPPGSTRVPKTETPGKNSFTVNSSYKNKEYEV